MKIGIFGGTFNPPHLGHLIVAEHVRIEYSLDRVMFMPASIPPHKLREQLVSSEHRAAMLRLAIQDNPNFDISQTELERGGISFTIDTLRELTKTHSEDHLFLLIGMDNLLEFHTWKSPHEILDVATVVVMTRPGFTTTENPLLKNEVLKICIVPEIAISSREIRKRIKEGKSIHYLVPDTVREYIRKHQLYTSKPNR